MAKKASSTNAPPSDDSKIDIGVKRYLELLEQDLWSKFNKRLWAVIAGLLTVSGLFGLFGVPTIVDNKVSSVFSERSKKFDEITSRYLGLYRTYFLLDNLRTHYRLALETHILQVAKYLDDERARSEKDQTPGSSPPLRSPYDVSQTLRDIANEKRAIKVLSSTFMLRPLFGELTRAEKTTIPLSESVRTETKVLSGGSSSTFGHPLRNGSLASFIADVQLRLLILASFESALDELKDEILSLGGASDFEKKTKLLEVESYIKTQFSPRYKDILVGLTKSAKIAVAAGDSSSWFEKTDRYVDLVKFYLSELGIELAGSTADIVPNVQVMKSTKESDKKKED